jgi:hypothetical protein
MIALANNHAFADVADHMLVQRGALCTLIIAAHGGCGSRPTAVSHVPAPVPQGRTSPSDRPESLGVPPAVGEICDSEDRIVVANARPVGNPVVAVHGATTELAGSVVVISRSEDTRVTAAIDRGSVLYDDCGGSAGSHAGCSDLGGYTIRSAALGSDELFLDPYGHRSVVAHDGVASPCRDSTAGRIAWCSTRKWFGVIDRADGGKPIIRIYRGGAAAIEEPATREPGRYTARRARLIIDKANGSIELDGEREPCLAVNVGAS